MKTAEYITLEEHHGAHNYYPLDVVITRAEGVWLYDVDGNRYLDCLSAYSAVNQGHVHPKILAALVDQANRVTLTSRAFRNDQLALFYKELSARLSTRMFQNDPARCNYPFTLNVSNGICVGYPPPEG